LIGLGGGSTSTISSFLQDASSAIASSKGTSKGPASVLGGMEGSIIDVFPRGRRAV
jgi:hypothetical protein